MKVRGFFRVTIIAVFSFVGLSWNLIFSQNVLYGDKIRFKHATGYYLKGTDGVYTHQGTSGQRKVVATKKKSDADMWIVKGAHKEGDRFNFKEGTPVKLGDVIRLESTLIGLNLHSHKETLPKTNATASSEVVKHEITLFELNGKKDGIGDSNDNWILEGSDSAANANQMIYEGRNYRIIHNDSVNQNESLKIALNFSPGVIYSDQTEEVAGLPSRNDNDFWTIDKVVRDHLYDMKHEKEEHHQKNGNLPVGFEEEEGDVFDVACGSRKGELEVWAPSLDGTALLHYATDYLGENPWIEVKALDDKGVSIVSSNGSAINTIDSVSVSSDGVMIALTTNGSAYMYNWDTKNFTLLPAGKDNENLGIDMISVGNAQNIWAVDFNERDLYQHTPSGWVSRAQGMATYVAAGVDGTVIALNEVGSPHMMIHEKKSISTTDSEIQWDKMGNIKLSSVAVGNKENIWGITLEGELMHYSSGVWVAIQDKDGKPVKGFEDVAVNAAGTVFAIDQSNKIFQKGDAGFVVAPNVEKVTKNTTTVNSQKKIVKDTSNVVNNVKKTGATVVNKAALKGKSSNVLKTSKPKKVTRFQSQKKGTLTVTKNNSVAKKVVKAPVVKRIKAAKKTGNAANKTGKKVAANKTGKKVAANKTGKKVADKKTIIKKSSINHSTTTIPK